MRTLRPARLAVPELVLEMRRRGHGEAAIQKVVYDNPLAFFRQSHRWAEPAAQGQARPVARAAAKERLPAKG